MRSQLRKVAIYMNKAQLIDLLSQKHDLSKSKIEEVLDGVLDLIVGTVKKGETVTLVGFGTFSAKQRKGRIGVNPQNPSEKITIPPVIVPKFKAGKNFKDTLKK